MAKSLSTLSLTSRHLREIALPLIWRCVTLRNVRHLALLHKNFILSLSFAGYVRNLECEAEDWSRLPDHDGVEAGGEKERVTPARRSPRLYIYCRFYEMKESRQCRIHRFSQSLQTWHSTATISPQRTTRSRSLAATFTALGRCPSLVNRLKHVIAFSDCAIRQLKLERLG